MRRLRGIRHREMREGFVKFALQRPPIYADDITTSPVRACARAKGAAAEATEARWSGPKPDRRP
jgi:hypothetical protein